MFFKKTDDALPNTAIVGGGGRDKVPFDSFFLELARCGFIVVDELLLEDLIRGCHVRAAVGYEMAGVGITGDKPTDCEDKRTGVLLHDDFSVNRSRRHTRKHDDPHLP